MPGVPEQEEAEPGFGLICQNPSLGLPPWRRGCCQTQKSQSLSPQLGASGLLCLCSQRKFLVSPHPLLVVQRPAACIWEGGWRQGGEESAPLERKGADQPAQHPCPAGALLALCRSGASLLPQFPSAPASGLST